MRISQRKILSRVTAGLSAAAMCFSMLPMSVIAEDSSMATVGGECIGDMGAIPMLPTVTTGSGDTQLNTGLGHFAFKWAYRKTIITNMKNPKQDCVDYTVKVKTKGGQQRTPWDFMTTEQWTMDSQNPYFFDATDTGDTKLMTWLPVLGTDDGQAILDTALALVRHKVNGEGEEVTFDHLIEKIQAIFSNVDLPNDIDDPTRSAFKSVDSEEQEKLIDAIDEPIGRFIRENQENGTPVSEINFTEKEKNTILDAVTGIMGLGYRYPTCGVREGDSVTMQLDEVLLKDDDGKYGLVDTSELKPIEFVIDLENNHKLIQNEDDHTAHVPEGENHIYQGGVHLTGVKSGTGYTLSGVSYAVNVGDYQATATLAEGYTWSDGTTAPKTINWSIKPAEIASVELNLNSYVYGENKNVSITSVKGNPVDPGQYDYSEIITNSNDMAVPAPSDAGTYTYTVIGKGNFTGSATATLTIKPDTIISAELEQDSFEYDGKAKTVAVKNAAGLYSTPTSNDYDVVYQKDATEPGTYPVNIMGKNNFEGSVLKNITIVDNRKELDKAEPAFPEGKDENSEYTKKEAQEIELQDETGSKLDKGTYIIDIKPSDDEKMWDIRFEPVEPISKGEKLVEVKRACEHEGTGRTYQQKDESVHSVYCAKADCLKFIADEAHSFKRMEDDKNVWEECEQCHATRDVTFTVTVTYSVAKGLKTPENFLTSQIKTGIKAGGSYSISSPVYKGLKASDAVVIGNIGKSNAEINVTYSECDHKDFTVTDFIKPTCTEDSKVVLATCDICGEDLVLTAEQIHALGDPYIATGHNFEEGEWRRESKQNSKPGKGHFHKCLNPGCYEREYEAHTWSGEQTYGEKCGVDFIITDECSICGTQYEYKPTECKLVRRSDLDVEPTCTEYGFEKYECTVCHSIASDAVQPLGHDYQTIEHTDATCTEKEYTKKECTRCKDVVEEYGKYRSENGQHNYVKHWVTKLTCTEDGESDGEVCSICGQKNPDSKEEYIPHQGHKVKAWVQTFGVVRDGTTKHGTPIQLTNYRSVHECENCGATLGIEEWTVATCSKPPKLEIAAGANAEIDDISGGIHIKGNMANDGGVTFNQNVLTEVKKFVNDGTISSKYTYKKTKSNSFIIEFSEMFLADLEDGTYPVEIVNGNEYWPLMVTVENHKLVALADQEYPTGDEITKAQLDEHLAKAEAEGAVIKNLFVVPLTEEELDGITFPEPEKEEDPKDEEPKEDEPTDEPEDSEGSENDEKADDKASDDKADSKADNTASDSTAATTGAATNNPKTGSTAPIMFAALLLGAAAVITKKRR